MSVRKCRVSIIGDCYTVRVIAFSLGGVFSGHSVYFCYGSYFWLQAKRHGAITQPIMAA